MVSEADVEAEAAGVEVVVKERPMMEKANTRRRKATTIFPKRFIRTARAEAAESSTTRRRKRNRSSDPNVRSST